ncbi:MAG: hypothetical protein PHQ35_11580, partial [Phycisphaerae bacterium]|nr:hypothetical protein [Phycisphaerae bacterium]
NAALDFIKTIDFKTHTLTPEEETQVNKWLVVLDNIINRYQSFAPTPKTSGKPEVQTANDFYKNLNFTTQGVTK